jgi:hypothetical protein
MCQITLKHPVQPNISINSVGYHRIAHKVLSNAVRNRHRIKYQIDKSIPKCKSEDSRRKEFSPGSKIMLKISENEPIACSLNVG